MLIILFINYYESTSQAVDILPAIYAGKVQGALGEFPRRSGKVGVID